MWITRFFGKKQKDDKRGKIINIVVGVDKKIQYVVEEVRFCTSYGRVFTNPHFKPF